MPATVIGILSSTSFKCAGALGKMRYYRPHRGISPAVTTARFAHPQSFKRWNSLSCLTDLAAKRVEHTEKSTTFHTSDRGRRAVTDTDPRNWIAPPVLGRQGAATFICYAAWKTAVCSAGKRAVRVVPQFGSLSMMRSPPGNRHPQDKPGTDEAARAQNPFAEWVQ